DLMRLGDAILVNSRTDTPRIGSAEPRRGFRLDAFKAAIEVLLELIKCSRLRRIAVLCANALIKLVQPANDKAQTPQAEADIEISQEAHPGIFLAGLFACSSLRCPLHGEDTGILRPCFHGAGKGKPVAWMRHRLA